MLNFVAYGVGTLGATATDPFTWLMFAACVIATISRIGSLAWVVVVIAFAIFNYMMIIKHGDVHFVQILWPKLVFGFVAHGVGVLINKIERRRAET